MLTSHSSQVGADHGEVHVGDVLDGLEFDDDLVAHQQVKPMQSYLDIPVQDGDSHLARKGHVSVTQLKYQGVFVDRLHEAGAQIPTVWPDVLVWLESEPDCTAKELFKRLQAEYPGDFRTGQLRTLQRRVKTWRKAAARKLVFTSDQNRL